MEALDHLGVVLVEPEAVVADDENGAIGHLAEVSVHHARGVEIFLDAEGLDILDDLLDAFVGLLDALVMGEGDGVGDLFEELAGLCCFSGTIGQ